MFTAHSGILPFKRKSRLLAPPENANLPSGFRQPCFPASHTLRSYRESVILTVLLSPGRKSTSSKPLSTLGGSPTSAGKCTYNCGICTRWTQ